MKKILALVLALCMVLALCACGESDTAAASSANEAAEAPAEATEAPAEAAAEEPAAEAAPSVSADLTVGTGGESGTYYAYTGVVSQVVSDVTDVKMTVVATGGSKANIIGIDEGMYDLATVQSDVMTYAYNGTASFEETGACTSFLTLCALYPETVQIVTFDESIKTVSDLAGKSVCVGDVGSGTYFNALDVFAAYGMTMDDVKPVYQSFGDSMESMQDGQIDAAFLCAGAPTPAVEQASAQKQIYVVSIDAEHMATLLENPMYAELTIPAGTYGITEDATTVTVKATLICRADLPDDVAYTIVKSIFENADTIAAGHSKGEYIDLTFATEGIAVPFANGAAQYFAENGITVATAG